MTVEEYIACACLRKNLNPMQHFVRVKKRRDMEDHNYFVPHRTDLIETYVSIMRSILTNIPRILLTIVSLYIFQPGNSKWNTSNFKDQPQAMQY